MVSQSAAVGVQYGYGTGCSLQLLVILAEALQCFPDESKHQGVALALVCVKKRAELGGEGKGNKDVVALYPSLELVVDPRL